MKRKAMAALALVVSMAVPSMSIAAGGSQNMLLIVNPNDENAVRAANAYKEFRNLSDSNILWIAPPTSAGLPLLSTVNDHTDPAQSNFRNYYVNPITQHLEQHGLTGQIDYIATLGQPNRVVGNVTLSNSTYGVSQVVTTNVSMSFALGKVAEMAENPNRQLATWASDPINLQIPGTSNFVRLGQGSVASALYQDPLLYTRGGNTAVRSSTVYNQQSFYGTTTPPSTASVDQQRFYMSGHLGWTGLWGTTTNQLIENLQRTAAADGTKPTGTIYLDNGTDIRVTTRSGQYTALKAQLDARGISWEMYNSLVPQNVSGVRGIVSGSAAPGQPNRMDYMLAGSFADNLTSFAGTLDSTPQSDGKMPYWQRAGAAGTSGTITEPTAIATRFPHSFIHLYLADGSSMGEAWVKSVREPTLQQFQGDLLSQAWADLPTITLNQGPTNGAQVSNAVAIQASASVTPSATTTGVAKMQLWVDGKLFQEVAGGAADFNLNTTTLSDGNHEVRVVAVNNSAAQSENYLIRNITVNNRGRGVEAPDSLTLAAKEQAQVTVAGIAGDGQVQRIELRHLGRLIGTVDGSAGAAAVDATKLGYGKNAIVPVAIFSDGSEVRGDAIQVIRQTPALKAGAPKVYPLQRYGGIRAEYFTLGVGANNATTNFNDKTPVLVEEYVDASLWQYSAGQNQWGTAPINVHLDKQKNNGDAIVDGNPTALGLRVSGHFNVDKDMEGQWDFFLVGPRQSITLKVDGETLFAYDLGLVMPDQVQGTAFLGEGDHYFEYTVNNILASGGSVVMPWLRGPDGMSRLFSDEFIYQVVPEPSGMAAVVLGAAGLLQRRRRREQP